MEDDKIPKTLWYKLGPAGLNNQTQEWTDSCIKNNPTYQPKFLTDEQADVYVADTFAYRPDIVETYLGLTIPILKADLLRYLLLLDQGGIWSDLDVSCEEIPIDEWIPAPYKGNASLVVGWEFDVGYSFEFKHQFATWLIMAKRGLPHMARVVDDIIKGIRERILLFNVTIGDLTLQMTGDVVDITGPRRFTSSVLESLRDSLDEPIPQESIQKIREPKLVGDVLILPGHAFAASSNTYEDDEYLDPALITHHYAGTWKNGHGGELA
jgi:mannosyltransferase OCH1-like enzyme